MGSDETGETGAKVVTNVGTKSKGEDLKEEDTDGLVLNISGSSLNVRSNQKPPVNTL